MDYRYSLSRFSALGRLGQLGSRRFGGGRFTRPGSLGTTSASVLTSSTVTVAAARDPSAFAGREGGIAAARTAVAGRALARPDLSPGVTVTFEEV